MLVEKPSRLLVLIVPAPLPVEGLLASGRNLPPGLVLLLVLVEETVKIDRKNADFSPCFMPDAACPPVSLFHELQERHRRAVQFGSRHKARESRVLASL